MQVHGIDTSKYKTSIVGTAIKSETKQEIKDKPKPKHTRKEIQEQTRAELARGFVSVHPEKMNEEGTINVT